MWRIIRDRQGVDAEIVFEETSAAAENSHHISRFAVRPNITPQDPLAVSEAFGDEKYKKYIRLMDSPELVHRQKSVNAILRLLKQGKEHGIRCMKYGITMPLRRRMNDASDPVRMVAYSIFSLLSEVAPIRKEILGDGNFDCKTYIRSLERVMRDAEADLRVHAVKSFCNLVSDDESSTAMMKSGLTDLLLDIIEVEDDSVKEAALMALNRMVRVDEVLQIVLQHGMLSLLRMCLSSSLDGTVKEAVNIISLSSYKPEVKVNAVKAGLLSPLVKLLTHSSWDVRELAVSSIALISISLEGKMEAIRAGIVSQLCQLLSDIVEKGKKDKKLRNSAVLNNVLQAISSFSEDPTAREELLSSCEEFLVPVCHWTDSAETTLAKVRWKP